MTCYITEVKFSIALTNNLQNTNLLVMAI